MSNAKKVKEFVDDARKSGVEMRPPSIERSVWEFEPEGDALRYGFGAIKGTGEKAITAVVAARDELRARRAAPSLHALCAQVDPQTTGKVCWEALIKAGAFDALDKDRGALLASVEAAMAEGARAAADRKAGQGSLFGDAPAPANGAARPASAAPRAGTLTKAEVLRAEFEVLGFYLSGHPLEERAGLLALLASTSIEGLAAIPGGTELNVSGMILGKSEVVVKSGSLAGRKMCRFRLEDLSGNVGVTCFPRTYEEQRHKLEDGRVVVLKVKLEEGAEEPALLLEEIWTIEEALARFQGGVVVQIEPEDEHLLADLRRVIDGHRGRAPLYLQVQGRDGRTRRVRAGGDCRVAISERFAADVDALLGQGRVRLARV
jgi:DNA polymerase-3 subunit alpha